MCLELAQLRDDFRVIAMSATVETPRGSPHKDAPGERTVGSLWLATSSPPAFEASRAKANEQARVISGMEARALSRPLRSAVE